jgi:glutathione S-transferase
MTVTITAFERSPDGGRGLARDTRVRWALEEVGVAYDVRLVSFAAMKEPAHMALQPFGQIPTFEEDGLVLFETGAIVLHLAMRHAGLLPDDENARSRAIAWVFAAVNTVEPPVLELANARLLEGDRPWFAERLPLVQDQVRNRLRQLSGRLGGADWLDGSFSAGDLMMCRCCCGCAPRGCSTNGRTWQRTLRGAKRDRPTRARSQRSGRSTSPPTRNQSNRLETELSSAMRRTASPIRGAIVSVRMVFEATVASVARMVSEMTSSLSAEALTRATAPPDSTPWVM